MGCVGSGARGHQVIQLPPVLWLLSKARRAPHPCATGTRVAPAKPAWGAQPRRPPAALPRKTCNLAGACWGRELGPGACRWLVAGSGRLLQARAATPLPLNLGCGNKGLWCCCQPMALPVVAREGGGIRRKQGDLRWLPAQPGHTTPIWATFLVCGFSLCHGTVLLPLLMWTEPTQDQAPGVYQAEDEPGLSTA